MDTFLRRLAILDYLSRARRARSTAEIIQHLSDAEYLPDTLTDSARQRLVQRDLNFLLGEPDEDGECFNPFGLIRLRGARKSWLWQLDTDSGLHYDWERMPSFMALTLGMTGKHLGPILPAHTQRELSGFLEQAERRLARESGRLTARHYRRLRDAVEFAQRGHALQAAPYDPAVLDTCYRAIIRQQVLGLDYQRANGTTQTYQVEVYGVAILLPKIYVVARKASGGDLRSFLLHRIQRAWLEPRPAHVPEDFCLRDWLAQGHMEVFVDPADRQPYRLHLIFTTPRPGLLEDLSQSPIAADQRLKQDTHGHWHLHATVLRTVQLRQWLMSVADIARVDAPACIRNDVCEWARALIDRQKDFE